MMHGLSSLSSTLTTALLAVSASSLLPSVAASEQTVLSTGSSLVTGISQAQNESLLWGPYRPNLYFGVRPRLPKSVLSGLMWTKSDDFVSIQKNMRHTCEQGEHMDGYGWTEYDPRTGGREIIRDKGNNIDITIDFVKVPGGEHGGSWGARVHGVPREPRGKPAVTTLVFYTGIEGFGSLEVENEPHPIGYTEDITIKGQSIELGDFKFDITHGPASNVYPPSEHESAGQKPLDHTFITSTQVPEQNLWQADAIVFSAMKPEVDAMVSQYGKANLPPPWQLFTIPNKPGNGNMHLVQKVFQGEFQFDILFSSGSAPEPMTSLGLTEAIKKNQASFQKRFDQIFKRTAPFDNEQYEAFSKSMFSNLVGGIGYFYGESLVDDSYASEYEEENEGFWEEAAEARRRANVVSTEPHELFTSIPSRPFFPRGFLWDEGFHLMPVADWDIDLTLDIVKSWFNLIDEDGWIAREQILGLEARSKVPAEFQVQYPVYANPPTLFLILETFTDKLRALSKGEQKDLDPSKLTEEDLRSSHLKSAEVASDYLQSIYPLIKRQYYWFRKTQWGDIKGYDREAYSQREGYRWRGRTPSHILTSGLDDYPRAQPPHPGELHVDLISWMGLMTRSIRRIAEYLDQSEDVDDFKAYEEAITRNINDLHWDEDEKTYCDATIDDYEESIHVCHKGYISIFPFLTGMIDPADPHLEHILDLISDPNEMRSPYGLRSLSKNDENYGTGENYWRSPIWVNINYMAIKNLLDLAQNKKSPYATRAAKIYTELRSDLVKNVYDQWKKTGFAWEQYNPETGKGQRTQHFTGWTSMVVKIMGMPDLSGGKKGKSEL